MFWHGWEPRENALKKSIIHASMLLIVILFGFSLIHPASSQSENLKVLNYSWYFDSLGGFDVVGEVQNVGSTILNPVVLGGIGYTPDGSPQTRSNPSVVYVNYMLPQQKAPFLMEFRSGDMSWLSQGVDHIGFEVVKAPANDTYQYPDLSITGSNSFVDTDGTCWVSGTIQNTGSQTATNVRAIATFYNSSNTVIAAGYSEPISSLSPLGSGAFKVGAFDLNQTLATPDRMVSSYTLIIQAAGPLLTGTPPEPSSYSSSFSTNSSTPSNPSNNSTDSGSNNNPSNPASSGLNYVAIVIVIIIIIGGLLAYSRIRSGKGSNKKQAKSQKTAKRQQSSKRD